MLRTSKLLIKSLNKTDSYFLIRSVFFVSKSNPFDVYFTSLQLVLVPCGGVRGSSHTSTQNGQYFISFEIIRPIEGYLKMFNSCIRKRA